MRKLKLFFACLLMAVLSIGQVWAGTATATLQISSGVTANGNLTDDASNTWAVSSDGSYTSNNSYIQCGTNKANVSYIRLTTSAFSSKKITKVQVWGTSKANTNVSAKVIIGSVTIGTSSVYTTQNASSGGTEFSVDNTNEETGELTIEISRASAATGAIYFNKAIVTYEDGGDPDPVLESITISGDLSNKSYEEGQSIDFTGLTATGHYNNSSTADLTDDVEWSFAPALTEGLTSVTVTATLNEISGNKVISDLIVAAAPAAVEYAIFSGELEEGDYVIYYGGYAMNNTIANDRLQYTEVTPSDNKITNPDASIVWHIAQSGSYWTIYNAAVAKYAAGTGAKNKAQLLADGTDNKSLWTASGDETYDFVNKANDAAGVNKTLRNNGTYGFACYATGTGGPLSLYKKVDDQVAVVKPAILGDTYFLTSSEVSMTCTTDGAEIHYTLDGSDPTATSTLYENPFTLTATTTVKAIAVKGTDVSAIAEKEFTKATVKTVAEALAMSATDDVYVIGYISAITEVSTEHKNATYRISDDGTKTGEMIVYRGKYLNNADFTEENKNNIHVGDKVVVRGGLVEYQNAMQLATGNYLISIEYPEVAIPTFEPAVESFLESVEVSLACSTDGAEIRYTLDGTDPTATSTLYKDPFTLTETKTVKAIAIKGGTTTNVVSKTYTKQEIMTVAEALASSAANGVYVKGIISTITEVSTSFKNATYRISDNGTKTDEMIVYRGRYINNTDFTSEDQIELGDEVVVYGNLVAYQNAMQLATGNYLISLVRKQPAGLAWNPAEDIEITVGDAFTAPSLTNPHGLTVTIASDNTELATVENGVVSLVADATGTAKITATFAGDDTYKAAEVSYTVTVSAAAPVLTDYYEKVTETAGIVEGTYLIVYEDASVAFNGGLETLDDTENTIDVAITNDNKIGVTSTTAASTFYIDPTAGTVQAKSGKYIGVSSNSNGLKTSDDATTYTHTFSIDESGDAVIATAFEGSTMSLRYNTANNQLRFRYYKDNGQQAIQLYKLANEVIKPEAGLAWDPAEDIELTVGGDFTAPALLNPNNINAAEITIASSNTNVATINNGEVELVADATGTTTITATFAGNDDFKPATVSYKIKVNPAHSIYVSPSLTVNFGSVAKDASVDDQVITVTLTEVPNATATLGGNNPEKFSITPAALTASGDITISVANTATAGTFEAKLTISDDASLATSRVVTLKLTVTDPAAEETPISTSTQWVAATAADLVNGKQVLITGVKNEVVYAMGEQKSTNRAGYAASVDGEGVLTPGEGTMAFTLVAQETEGVFALRTSDGKYLYAAGDGANHLKTQDNVDVNAQWTLSVTSAVATGSSNRNVMQFNGSGTNKLFSCYASANQSAIQFYVPKPVTPPTPVYETVREGLTAGKYYTICYPKAMTDVQGATLWSFVGKDANFAYIEQETATTIEAGKPYIMYATASTVTAVLGDETNAAGANGAIHGTFSNLAQDQLNNYATVAGSDLYLVIGNELRRATGDGTGSNTLPAYRAFVVVNDIPDGAPAQAPGKKVRSMPMHKDTTTGVENAEASEKPVKLLLNGQIFILRGEKMYDATGRLVK